MGSRATRSASPDPNSFEIHDLDLRPPALSEGLLERGYLVDRLASAHHARVVTLVAPAGYGKTTLMAHWMRSTSRPAAWLTLDFNDNDPVMLLSRLWAAFTHAGMVVPDDAAGPRGSSTPAIEGIPRLARALHLSAERGLLFLDHLESLRSRASWDVIAALIHRLDGVVQVVLASRSEPNIPLGAIRAERFLVELTAPDLAFNENEASQVLDHMGVEHHDLAEIMANTEGWPVGVYLTALALERGSSDSAPIQAVRGDDLYVADYVHQAVLGRMSEAKRSFLMRTSILDRLSGPLCDTVLETTGSERLLESLEKSNLLIVRLDRTKEWHRYHHMFQHALQAELRLREPDVVIGLHERAAEWFEVNGYFEHAIRHAQAAGDVARVARIVERIGRVTYSTGRSETLFGWLDWLEEQNALVDHPTISAMGALAAALSGDLVRGAAWFDLLENETHPLARLVRALRTPSGVEAMIEDVRQARHDFPSGSEWSPACLAVEGLGRLWLGEHERADSLFERAISLTEPLRAVPTATITLAARALIAMQAGDWGYA